MTKQKKQSKPEQLALPVLAKYGFIPCQDKFFPVSFIDDEGIDFNAKPDFYNPELGIYIEVKDSYLNGKQSQRTAENAFKRVEPWRYNKSPTYNQIEHQWNHSAVKQAIVQYTLTPARFMIVFTGKPDESTLKRIVNNGIEAYSLARFSLFMLRWRLGQYHMDD
jgi:hypothetical protein